ncbi:MAG: MerR family transcriptional regulator [Candidatus Omnitrophica bacterium]|nr:MerR family transcriptional regulator [Candidatus Omnitrophota bacterium]
MVKNLKRKDRLKLGLLKLGEIASRTNTLPSTIRYYSNLGLLKISGYTQGKYRLFKKDETVARVLKIKELKQRGLTLGEIKKRFG